MFFHIQHIVVILLYRFNDSIFPNFIRNLKRIVCTDIYKEKEVWLPSFLDSMRNMRSYVLIQTINSTRSFVVFFDALRFLNITVTTLYLYISLKRSWHYPQFATSADPLSGFSISFTGFSGALFTLFNRTVSVAAMLFSLKERSS